MKTGLWVFGLGMIAVCIHMGWMFPIACLIFGGCPKVILLFVVAVAMTLALLFAIGARKLSGGEGND